MFLYPASKTLADQSEGFTRKGYYWYDDWGVNRNNAAGDDGYLPAIVYESLGQNVELAHQFGRWFLTEYSDRVTRAEKIMSFVQSMVKYKYDEENPYVLAVTRNDKQEEWAWNPDEMAHMIALAYDNREVAYGDCEDFAFILTVMYFAAGYDVTIVDATDHIAILIWLPEYPNANVYWDVDDGRGAGWIWVEATGDRNPLGWTPDDYKQTTINKVRELETGLFLLEVQENGFDSIDCLVSVATIESELQRELKFIRGFRDNLIKSTFVGSQFTEIFNVWYYSFSPSIAHYIAKDQAAQMAVKVFLYPLMGIMHISFLIQHFLTFNLELSVVMAILSASLLIGAVYFSLPMTALIALMDKYVCNMVTVKRRTYFVLVTPLLVSLVMMGLGEFTNIPQLMMASSGIMVLTSISASAIIISIKIAGKFFASNPKSNQLIDL